jgi:hypothetical protein
MIMGIEFITCPAISFTVEQLSAARRASGGFAAKQKQSLLDGDIRADDLNKCSDLKRQASLRWNFIPSLFSCA